MTYQSLQCESLSKSFDGSKALVDVTLRMPRTGIVAVIGPNGAGKTTLMNVWTGFIRPDAGHCALGDRDITQLAPHRIARLGIARTFQDLRLIQQVSALDNVMLARPNQRGERLWAALLRIGVKDEEEGNRNAAMKQLESVGLKKQADQLAGELSYGQQKLLTLACCLATEPRIILLDEPVAGVHHDMAKQILDLLRQLRDGGRLIVFIEHDISAVRRIADHVIVMDAGRIISEGPPTDVLERPEILEAYID